MATILFDFDATIHFSFILQKKGEESTITEVTRFLPRGTSYQSLELAEIKKQLELNDFDTVKNYRVIISIAETSKHP